MPEGSSSDAPVMSPGPMARTYARQPAGSCSGVRSSLLVGRFSPAGPSRFSRSADASLLSVTAARAFPCPDVVKPGVGVESLPRDPGGGHMKSRAALLFDSPGPWEVREVDVDPPKDHEVLVRMVASGLCHSDVHYKIGDQVTAMPMCGGHEGAGVVEEVGPGVERLKPGDHVVTSFIPSCGHCRYCASGRQNLCQRGGRLQIGPQLDGTYRMHYAGEGVSQFMLISTFSAWSTVHEDSLVKIPNDVPLETACILGCGVGTGFGSAVNAANVRTG